MVAEDAMLGTMLVKEEIDGLGDWERSMSAYLTSGKKMVLGGGIGRLLVLNAASGRPDLGGKIISL